MHVPRPASKRPEVPMEIVPAAQLDSEPLQRGDIALLVRSGSIGLRWLRKSALLSRCPPAEDVAAKQSQICGACWMPRGSASARMNLGEQGCDHVISAEPPL
jgi:hypothetical protein